MGLFKRRGAKASSNDEKKMKSNDGGLDGSRDDKGRLQMHRIPAGGPPCSCQACKMGIPSSCRSKQLKSQPTVIIEDENPAYTRLNHGFGTVTVATQTVSIQTRTEAIDDDVNNVPWNSVKMQHNASQTDIPKKSEKTRYMASQSSFEVFSHSNDSRKSKANDHIRKRDNTRSNKANSLLKRDKYRNELKQISEKKKNNQNNESIWRRPTIVVQSNKNKEDEKIIFRNRDRVIKPEDNDADNEEEDDDIDNRQQRSSNCPNCMKIDELVHKVFRLQQEMENQEYHIYQLQHSVNILKKEGIREMKQKDSQTSIEKEKSVIIKPESIPKSVPDQPNVYDKVTCECQTLYEQFMKIFLKPEENEQSNDLSSNCEVGAKAKIFDLENFFREFIRLFIKPMEPKTGDCDDKKIHSLGSILEPPQTVNTCSQIQRIDNLFREFLKLFIKPPEPGTGDCDDNKVIQSLCSLLDPPQVVNTCSQIQNLETSKKGGDKKSKDIGKHVSAAPTPTLISNCKISDLKLDECPCPSQQISIKNLASNSLLQRQQSSLCQFCRHKNLPVLDDLINELIMIIGKRRYKDIVLTVLLRADNIYHVNVREIDTGRVLGCLLVNDEAIDDAISSGLFENIVTYCVLDARSTIKPKVRPFGIPFEFIHDVRNMDRQREPGGENNDSVEKEAKNCEFAVKVLGLPIEYKERMFSLTNAVKLAKQRSQYQLQIASNEEHLGGKE